MRRLRFTSIAGIRESIVAMPATLRRIAETGLGNQPMKAISGHAKGEVARYAAAMG
jgi:hypothetical protein